MSEFDGHYIKWRDKRMKFIFNLLKPEVFKGETVLVLGDGQGDIGHEFYRAGAIVTCVEGRQEHIDIGKERFPHLIFICADLNLYEIADTYDYIISMGLLYHLKRPRFHLNQICQHGEVIILESEVLDLKKPVVKYVDEGRWYDQGLDFKGCKPTEMYVENMFKKNKRNFTKYMSKELNSNIHQYDWESKNDGTDIMGRRRLWVLK